MISKRTLLSLEFNKILSMVAEYAVLENTKKEILEFNPLNEIKEVEFLLSKTEEAFKYLYTYSVGGIPFFDNIEEPLKRVDMGATLNNSELLKVADNLKGARVVRNQLLAVNDETFSYLPEIAKRLYVNNDFEKEIYSKILSEDTVADTASDRLYSIRKSIRDIKARIGAELNSYMHSGLTKYLQDAVVTIRGDRYVIPVKSEYRGQVKGFIHDQSSSGSTVFIEPEIVMELNNDLKRAYIDEADEIYNILSDLSQKTTFMSNALRYNEQNVVEIDNAFARAYFAFEFHCFRPFVNDVGEIDIINGRHPLISKDKVVPINVSLGKEYNFLLLTGPNTGGKTVTMKLVGLFALMTMSGMFIPASSGSKISVFNGVYTDIGDEQSIEQSLSTFSSHITNIISILNNLDNKSLVLIDEIGVGTDPEEGSALALAIINKLLSFNCFGIITTHYSKLKEFAIENGKIENACMEFDAKSLKPLYKLSIGIPGSSNALDISKSLGIGDDVIDMAKSYMSSETIGFEKVLKRAEEERLKAENLSRDLEELKLLKQQEIDVLQAEKEKIIKEREKIYSNARLETKRIVLERLQDAEEIVAELKTILKNANLESKDLFRASQLKNKLYNSKFIDDFNEDEPIELNKPTEKQLKIGNRVYVKSLGTYAKLVALKKNKKEAEVVFGNIKTVVKVSEIYNSEEIKEESNVRVSKSSIMFLPKTEINIIGKTSLEALTEIKAFLDQAIVNNLTEIRIIHGVGEGVLLKTVRDYLKKDNNVKEYRRGRYGEGENGVTVVTLK